MTSYPRLQVGRSGSDLVNGLIEKDFSDRQVGVGPSERFDRSMVLWFGSDRER